MFAKQGRNVMDQQDVQQKERRAVLQAALGGIAGAAVIAATAPARALAEAGNPATPGQHNKEKTGMLRFQRSARAKNGKFLEAIQAAKEVAGYINGKYPPASFQVFVERFGEFGTIYLQADYKDLASLESITAQIQADQEYWAHLKKAADLLIEGSSRETLMTAV
jgi:hypothetical protein